MTPYILGYSVINERKNETPMTGSTMLGEAFNRANTNAAMAVITRNYTVGSAITGLGVFNEVANGEFDEVFISYGSNGAPLKIACVITKVILS